MENSIKVGYDSKTNLYTFKTPGSYTAKNVCVNGKPITDPLRGQKVGELMTINEKPETPGSPSRRAPDMTKSTSLTGFESRISLHNGIEKTFKWYKKNVFDQNLENAI